MRRRFLLVLASLSVTALLVGCASSGRPRGTSGFLGDYSALVEGRENQARLIYIHPAADFSQYDAIIIDPIEVWDGKTGTPAHDPSAEDEQQARYFHATLRRYFARAYRLVAGPEKNTLRLSIALTAGKGFEGNIEAQLTDAMSLQRLAAAVDDVESVYSDDDAAADSDDMRPFYDRWALLLVNRFVALRDFDAAQKKADQALRD